MHIRDLVSYKNVHKENCKLKQISATIDYETVYSFMINGATHKCILDNSRREKCQVEFGNTQSLTFYETDILL